MAADIEIFPKQGKYRATLHTESPLLRHTAEFDFVPADNDEATIREVVRSLKEAGKITEDEKLTVLID